ncbi:MAG: hypothetical protein LIP77_00780, partial [Planctomycetes bacterium]|nr:hypothetical protein [Planctomycetota bacterium]
SDRVPAFSTLGERETYFFLANPGSDVLRGNHAGNFLDVWRVKQRAVDAATAEVAAGFAENVAIVSNNAGLAARSMDLLAGGANTADSLWGRRLAASLATSTSTDAIAFLRMDKLLQGLAATPLARQSVVNWADFIGHGGRDGEALYYGLEFTPDGARETYLLPVSAQTVSASLVELLAKRLRPIEGWSTPMVIPYQPNPSMFFAANLEGRQLGGILRQERRLFGSPGSAESFTVPDAARHLFTSDILALLRGEIGLAFFPDGDGQSWLMVLPCSSNPEPAFIRSEMKVERSGVTINSRDANWRENVCWAAISQNIFRRLPGDFLVIASHGDLMLATVDQLFNGSTFTNNKDFARAMADAEGNQGLMLYLNIPEIIVRQYPNLSAIMRSLYPRSSGLNSRPPLAMLRRYARGLMAVIAPMGEGDDFIRVTVQSPAPSLGMVAAGVVLGFPTSLRQDGRQAMEKSRENLQTLWLRLQLYASRYGHFPETLEDLAAEMRAPGVPNEFIRNLFIAPAALSRLNAREAATQSYQYVSGVTPNDEPDLPIVYEAEPWSEEFTGWYPLTGSGRGRSESGDFVPYRQYIRLDGQVVVMTDKSFRERVLPRLVERE